MKKSRLIALSLAAVMVAGTLVGCGGNDNTQTTQSSNSEGTESQVPDSRPAADGQPVYGGTLVVALPQSPKTLDPVQYTTMYEKHIMYNVADTLFIWDEEYKAPIPNLATDCEVSEDGLQYTINLRDDVYFQPGKYQDGRKMVADDVKYSLERIASDCPTDRICRDFFDYVEVVTDTQVIIHMKSPAGPFFDQLTDGGNIIVPREEVEGWGDEFGFNLVGTGPFILENIVTDESVTLKKNPNYWGPEPYLDGVEFKIISDTTQMVNALQTGELDIAMYLQAEAIQTAIDNGLALQTDSSAVTYVRFNMQQGPTADVKVREALIAAVNIDEMVQGIYQYNEASRAYLPLPTMSWGYDAKFEDLVPSYDPEYAKELLAEAGYPDGFTMTLYIGTTSNREKMAQLLQYYWGEIGVTLDIKASTMADWQAAIDQSWKADVVNSYGVSWNSAPDPYGFLEKFFSEKTLDASSNAGGYTDPEVEQWLFDAFQLVDQKERTELYSKVMEKVMNDHTGIYYSYEKRNWGVSEKVQDPVLRADSELIIVSPFNNIWKSE